MSYGLARDIQTCRGHHAVLREKLERFPAPVAAHAVQIRTALRELETVLLRHLAFEEMRLYPVLEAAAPPLADRARRYHEEMGDLSGRIIAFLQRWSCERAVEAEPHAFAQAWAAVRRALECRMAAEDDELYDAAERCSS
jgi:hemerythrin HHE cation binding domain-containing protein